MEIKTSRNGMPVGGAWAVDAACSGNPGPMEYQCIDMTTGQRVFHFGPIHGTNNIGEFLAIVHALALMEKQGIKDKVIYSDSVNAQLWVQKKKCKTKLEHTPQTAKLHEIILNAEKWLATHSFRAPILKWDTKEWGEIPADFGRKGTKPKTPPVLPQGEVIASSGETPPVLPQGEVIASSVEQTVGAPSLGEGRGGFSIPYLSLQKVTAMHGREISEAVQRVVQNGWYLQGAEVATFEKEYAGYCHARHCVSCANGLDALTLTLRSLKELGRLHEGDEVIVSANTYIATILSITENGLVPVLVEPRLENFQIDDSKIEAALTDKTRAIMLVNLYGYDSYTPLIGQLCQEHSLMLFIDNAQGHGLPLPSEATAVCHSFYPGKNLGALGDAGAMTTDDAELAKMMRTLCNYGSEEKYVFGHQGRNSRMDEVQAAVLRVKLRYLDIENHRRSDIAKALIEGIKNPLITLPPLSGVHHIFPILCKNRESLQAYLLDKGIHTMIHYPIPPHRQGAYKEWNDRSYPITERIHAEELSLPCNQMMTDAEVEYIIKVMEEYGR